MSKTISGTTTQFVYDGWNPVQELNASKHPSVTANLLTGLRIDEYFTRRASGATSSILSDPLRSTICLVTGQQRPDLYELHVSAIWRDDAGRLDKWQKP